MSKFIFSYQQRFSKNLIKFFKPSNRFYNYQTRSVKSKNYGKSEIAAYQDTDPIVWKDLLNIDELSLEWCSM